MPLRLVNFLPAPGELPHCGAWTEAGIIDLTVAAALAAQTLAGRFPDVVAALSSPEQVELARELSEMGAVEPVSREAVTLLPPVPRPGKLFLLAGNYLGHIEESAQAGAKQGMPQEWRGGPRVFMKPSVDTVIADGEPILLARTATWLDYEAELAVIIARPAKYLPPERALECVGAITALNDVSERQLSVWDRGEYAAAYKWFDWLNGKWTDTSAPMGPCAVPLQDVPDLDALRLRLELNGEKMQDALTGEMLFKVPEVVSYLSQICALRPGDVISMGTPPGVGLARGIKLQPGDVVTVDLDLVGRLTNTVIAES
jgi:2-keto-4-pentenoate hydratase/2-oxohepta-3-ene-1,7-dioic acid hydratase in catechol pathway